MRRKIFVFFLSVVIFAAPACTKQKEPEKKTMTTREKAEAVGKFGDRTLTNDLEKNLTGIVDKAAERRDELEKAANQ